MGRLQVEEISCSAFEKVRSGSFQRAFHKGRGVETPGMQKSTEPRKRKRRDVKSLTSEKVKRKKKIKGS